MTLAKILKLISLNSIRETAICLFPLFLSLPSVFPLSIHVYMYIYIEIDHENTTTLNRDKIDKRLSVAREVNICQPLSPVCWRMWLTRCSFLVNDLEQKPHRCGDSPVCWRTWLRRCSFRVNVFEQKSQRCGVSPVCHIMWFVKCSFLVNDLPAWGGSVQTEKENQK